MKMLQAGDIRQKGDEVRLLPYTDKERKTLNIKTELDTSWRPTIAPGRVILPSDLMNAEFRRP